MQSAFALAAPLRASTSTLARHVAARRAARPGVFSPYAAPAAPCAARRSAPMRCLADGGGGGGGAPSPASATATATKTETAPAGGDGTLRLLWDSECPLCVREVNGLRARAAALGVTDVLFVDIAEPAYDADVNGGVSYRDAMGRIHAVMPDGEVVAGVEVFRRVYEALGLGWVYAPTKIPVVGAVVEKAYDVWAVNRLRLTGRPTLDEIVAAREKAQAIRERGDGTCQ